MRKSKPESQLVICLSNTDYPESLEVRKLYRVLPDISAERDNFIRIVDETGEDYLYPANMFIKVELPAAIGRRLLKAS